MQQPVGQFVDDCAHARLLSPGEASVALDHTVERGSELGEGDPGAHDQLAEVDGGGDDRAVVGAAGSGNQVGDGSRQLRAGGCGFLETLCDAAGPDRHPQAELGQRLQSLVSLQPRRQRTEGVAEHPRHRVERRGLAHATPPSRIAYASSSSASAPGQRTTNSR